MNLQVSAANVLQHVQSMRIDAQNRLERQAAHDCTTPRYHNLRGQYAVLCNVEQDIREMLS